MGKTFVGLLVRRRLNSLFTKQLIVSLLPRGAIDRRVGTIIQDLLKTMQTEEVSMSVF